MFESNYPLFASGRLLKVDMLKGLRDYPREVINVMFEKYSNGIIGGCDLEVMDNFIIIKKGVLKYQENIYVLSKDYPIKYENNNVSTSLKIKFMPSYNSADYIKNETEIYLDVDNEVKDDEMELCRFKLRNGAKLRKKYISFLDFSTEFDTVNIINAPYASYASSSLSPYILRSFGLEMLKCSLSESFDITFAYLCVQSKETIDKQIIINYIVNKLNVEYRDYSNKEMYDYLYSILQEIQEGKNSNMRSRNGRYKKIIID